MDIYDAFVKSGANEIGLDLVADAPGAFKTPKVEPLRIRLPPSAKPTSAKKRANENESGDNVSNCSSLSAASTPSTIVPAKKTKNSEDDDDLTLRAPSDDDEEKLPALDNTKNEPTKRIMAVDFTDDNQDATFNNDNKIDVMGFSGDESANVPEPGDKNENFQWDFDVMRARRKAERSYGTRRSSGEINLDCNEEIRIIRLVEAMNHAAKVDRLANKLQKPGIEKHKLLPLVKNLLLRISLKDVMADNGVMIAVTEWLMPLPDLSLPSFEIRNSLLKSLQPYVLEQGTLRQSGLGKAVMLLYKHPKETVENRQLARNLIQAWARPIFGLSTEFGSMSREERRRWDEERAQRDQAHKAALLKKGRHRRSKPVQKSKSNTDEDNSLQSDSDEERMEEKPEPFLHQKKESKTLIRARRPKVSYTDYVNRPKKTQELDFGDEEIVNTKGHSFNHPLAKLLDKKKRHSRG